MRITQSLRWRMQFWHGLLLASALLGFGLVAYQYQKDSALKLVDVSLEQQMSVVVAAVRDEGRSTKRPGRVRHVPRGQRPGLLREFLASEEARQLLESNGIDSDYLVIWSREKAELGRLGHPTEEISFPKEADDNYYFNVKRSRKDVREVYRYLQAGECVLLGKSIDPELAQLHRLSWQLAGSGVAILGLGLLGGWFFLSRAIRPIHAISQSARRFAGGRLDERIPGKDVGGELGQLTADLNETFGQVEEAFAQQTRFTADAAHELRTPVSVILSNSQAALTRERDSETYKEALGTCERGAKRLQGLIDSLLSLSTIDTHSNTAPMVPLDLARVVKECSGFMKSLAQKRRLQLVTNLTSATCLGDADQLHQVLVNLIGNAINSSEEGGAIHLSTGEDEEGNIFARIQDDGKGIAPEHLPHLFERFYRADSSRKRGAGGAGLGLAICNEIVTGHGGSITVESEVGIGTTVTVRIPLVGEAARSTQ